MKLFLLALFIGLTFSGCSSWVPDYSREDSGYRLVLHKPLIVSPGNARVLLQQGKMLPSLNFNQYDISCSFEVRKLSERPQTIEADTFVVTRIQHLMEEVASWRPVRLASLTLAGADVDASPADIFLGYHFWLYSEKQPDVLRMTCRGAFSEPWDAQYPTLGEIAAALGPWATLETGTQTIKPGSY
ncbi:hypothetical protein [Thiolapillus sp.]